MSRFTTSLTFFDSNLLAKLTALTASRGMRKQKMLEKGKFFFKFSLFTCEILLFTWLTMLKTQQAYL